MQEIIDELKTKVSFKDMTSIGDIVLIVEKESKMMIYYAYIHEIKRDLTRRDEWWHVHLSVLTIPPQKMIWTLRTGQMRGMEIFTMGGKKRFVKAVDFGDVEIPKQTGLKRQQKTSMLKRVK